MLQYNSEIIQHSLHYQERSLDSSCAITKTSDPKSPEVGRAQGMYACDSRVGWVEFTCYDINSVHKQRVKWKHHTNTRWLEAVRELAVVASTRKFHVAWGYATFGTYFLDIPRKNWLNSSWSNLFCYVALFGTWVYQTQVPSIIFYQITMMLGTQVW